MTLQDIIYITQTDITQYTVDVNPHKYCHYIYGDGSIAMLDIFDIYLEKHELICMSYC